MCKVLLLLMLPSCSISSEIVVRYCTMLLLDEGLQLLKRYGWPRFLVRIWPFSIYSGVEEQTVFKVACCEEGKRDDLLKEMEDLGYRAMEDFCQISLCHGTTMRLNLEGHYRIANGPVTLE